MHEHNRTDPPGHDPTGPSRSPEVRMDKILSARQSILLGEAYIDRTIDRTVDRIQGELDSAHRD